MKKALPYSIAAILAVFGLVTLFLSGSVILDLFGIRAKEGNYVLFIVWANFISSILYLVAAVGFIKLKTWTLRPLGVSVLVLVLAFAGLLVHINTGGIYETKTIGAMVFRIIVTSVFTVFAYFMISERNK
ncbi:MAG: hypothetical protein FD155_3316 [Bacteroidetes bacterium]|nr:MAG: hypothetical protein FD155_3316 [Bacteroidota bacterium]